MAEEKELWYKIIKKIAKNKGITQTMISEKSGLSKSYVSEILSGKKEPKVSRFVAICLAVGVAPIISMQDKK